MSILEWFANKKKSVVGSKKLNIPGHLWVKCPKCNEVLFKKDLELTFKVCTACEFHFRITPEERIKYFFDENSFVEMDKTIEAVDFLSFSDTEKYDDRIPPL